MHRIDAEAVWARAGQRGHPIQIHRGARPTAVAVLKQGLVYSYWLEWAPDAFQANAQPRGRMGLMGANEPRRRLG